MLEHRRIPGVVWWLVGSCVGVYALMWTAGLLAPWLLRVALALFALWPGERFGLWQVVTYGFIHANLLHLALNMFALLTFGTLMTRVWSGKRLFAYFLFSLCLLYTSPSPRD